MAHDQPVRTHSVLAYFGDDPDRAYQLIQWLPVLELLDATEPVGLVLRDEATADLLRELTTLPVLVAEEFAELRELFAELGAKVVLYCNNSLHNFQSLLEPRMLHVHINHGESDKQSMASNNAKSYDRVFVAGEAAVQRIASGLLEFDTAKLVRIGRPQLDLRREPLLPFSERRTVLYAPTWEGDADYNNYSSVDRFGPGLVRRLLAVPDVRVVYKPHPRVATSEDPAMSAAHREITWLLAGDDEHVALPGADILAVMPDCDAMVTDVSSVGLDWLYLRTDRPLFIADRHDDPERLRVEAPVSRCADVVDSTNLAELTELMAQRLDHDELHLQRIAMRHHYFDDVKVGDSTVRFLTEVRELVTLRDRLLPGYEQVAT
jgi:CDP-Glycerol:Poly(glycerophosphate) glycerophosphotransferase